MVVHGPSLPVNIPSQPTGVEQQRTIERQAPPLPARELSAENSLWQILTEEERQFFAQQAELGPVTYGPAQSNPQRADAPLGQRVDVRI